MRSWPTLSATIGPFDSIPPLLKKRTRPVKLNQILNQSNQFERSKFINCLDKLCTEAKANDAELAQRMDAIDGQLKQASEAQVAQLFLAGVDHFRDFIRNELTLQGAQVALLINILVRDGNCVARISWIERLFAAEHTRMAELSGSIAKEINETENSADLAQRGARLTLYRKCFETAYTNDLRYNREARISDDERSVLTTLGSGLGLSSDEVFAIEHSIVAIPESGLPDTLNVLRDMGLLFINKRTSEVLVPDEIVDILHQIQGKTLSDKLYLRILRALTDPELSLVLRSHGRIARGVERADKIHFILHSGISIIALLTNEIHKPDATIQQKKNRISALIDELELKTTRKGSTLAERTELLVESLKDGVEREFEILSASGFKELVESLASTSPDVYTRLRTEFEIEDNERLDTERLRALGISPLDILNTYSNEEVAAIRDRLGLSKREKPRAAILQSYANANSKLLENYELLATRDLRGLATAGIEIREAELGAKFEEITRTLFENLGLHVDEERRKEINTAKDKLDIVLSLGSEDIIVCEVKSFKNGEYAKYSSTARQVKSYVARCEASGYRVSQVLIVAPAFSADFVEAAEMDADINVSLLEAGGLRKILSAYQAKKKPNFSVRLLTKGGLLKADLIAKTL